ncbi:MAG: RidA family protein [Alphaproteobacteria bacterium]
MQQLLPAGWKRPSGYSAGIAAQGRMVFTAGIIGWNGQEEFESDTFAGQLRQALLSIRDILAEADAKPEHIVRMTWYISDKAEYQANLGEIGVVWGEVLGKVFPAMAVIEIKGLLEERAKIEIEATAVVPD